MPDKLKWEPPSLRPVDIKDGVDSPVACLDGSTPDNSCGNGTTTAQCSEGTTADY